MERKLHPSFQQIHSPKIQTQFDPTPASLTQNLESSKNALKADIQEHTQETMLKFNRLSQKISQLEGRIDHVTADLRGAYSKIAARVSERSLNDTKIESMIEKHNQMVNAFEKRLMQMTKLIEDSQAQLLTTQGALEEARREIARLKRI